MTEDDLVESIFDKEGRHYADRPTIDQPTAPGGIILDTLREYVTETGAKLEVSVETLKKLTVQQVRPIVRWKLEKLSKQYGIDKLTYEPLRLQMKDFAYNSGTFSVRWLQRVLRLEPDGVLGPKTAKAANDADGWLVHHALIAARTQMIDMWTDAEQRRKAWEEGLENRALSFSMLLEKRKP